MTFHLDLQSGCDGQPSPDPFEHWFAVGVVIFILIATGVGYGIYQANATAWEDTGTITKNQPVFHNAQWFQGLTILTLHHGSIYKEQCRTIFCNTYSLNETIGIIAHPNGAYDLVSQ